MPLVALTGGIASGKSTIARGLAAHGAVIVDADALVRELQQPGMPVLAAIAAEFGEHLLLPDGSLDRGALGAVIFHDPGARHRLNAIVHPAVAEESGRRFRAAFAVDPAAVVVYDVPLLVEARPDDPWDLVVVAHAPADIRVARLMELRGMDEADARARVTSQASDERRLAIADVVIDTAGELSATIEQVDALWERLAEQRVGGRS
ncbi:dephospho-CoA kinase [Agrococcus sp. ARC_14]|uniref:dephospho-CoA kinase n=1 Tax=Agrococcus sp. ARC_14 TaxID=2919927 RepID=UPI001F0533F5|nr:dephospho-CoA kinase [Agrococcus sp. ARC_14]MCH1883128.1 dephospho-CoA kinase [Agrococcus sp. ARC_14]